MHIAHFMMNVVGMTVFPFVSKPLMMRKLKLSPEEYKELLEERKKIVPDILIRYLYLEPPG